MKQLEKYPQREAAAAYLAAALDNASSISQLIFRLVEKSNVVLSSKNFIKSADIDHGNGSGNVVGSVINLTREILRKDGSFYLMLWDNGFRQNDIIDTKSEYYDKRFYPDLVQTLKVDDESQLSLCLEKVFNQSISFYCVLILSRTNSLHVDDIFAFGISAFDQEGIIVWLP